MTTASEYRRQQLLRWGLLLGFAWLGWRLYEIQILRHQELARKAREYTDAVRVIEPWRGEILDRNHTQLALPTPVKSIYINLQLCSNRVAQVVPTCSRLLNVSAPELRGCLETALKEQTNGIASQKALLLLKNMPPAEWNEIKSALLLENFGWDRSPAAAREQDVLKKLRARLLFAEDKQERVHPYGTVLSHVLGARGIGGMEQACESILAGQPGRCVSEQDAAGNELPWRRLEYTPATNGNNVVLTIDLPLQQQVEAIVEAARGEFHACTASAMVMDPRTFEILALASSPNFDPQNPGASPPQCFRNPVFTDMEEPGSTFKIILLAAILDAGKFTLDDGVFCENGEWQSDHTVVHDHGAYGLLTIRQGFAKSSNIMFGKLANGLGPAAFYHQMTNFGFGNYTHTPFIREAPGRIDRPVNWARLGLTTRAGFGQGFSISQLQLATAVAVIANGGCLMQPRLVSRVESPGGKVLQSWPPQFVRRVVSPETAAKVTEAMIAVVTEGTGTRVALSGYTMAAKTGTAQKSNDKGYIPGAYYSSMAGFFPADAPRFVIVVALDEPQLGYYAADVAAPAFRAIAEQAAIRFHIPPDKPVSPSKELPARPTAVAVAQTSGAGFAMRRQAAQPAQKNLAYNSRP